MVPFKIFFFFGFFYALGNLKSFEWSANEKYLLYIAEAKQKKTESYFKNLFCDTTEQNPPAEKTEQKPSEETIKVSFFFGKTCL